MNKWLCVRLECARPNVQIRADSYQSLKIGILLSWLPCQTPSVMESVLEMVGPVVEHGDLAI